MFTFPFTMMSSADDAYSPAAALMFDGAADILSRTPSSAGNRKKFTVSTWFKRVKLGTLQYLFAANGSGPVDFFYASFDANDKLRVLFQREDDQAQIDWLSTQVFRDTTSWANLVVAVDSSIASPTFKVFYNGSEITAWTKTTNSLSQNEVSSWNADRPHAIGARSDPTYYSPFMIADVINLDGTASSDASEFGETDSATGIWRAKDPSTISSFGTNGFWLAFDDPTHANGVGKDSSGNNNHFTPTSIDASNIAGGDGPANSDTKEITIYPVIDPVGPWGIAQNTLSNNNLTYVSGTTNDKWNYSTIPISNTDKVYMEFLLNGNSSGSAAPGFNVSKRGHPGAHGVYPGGNEQENWGLYIGNGDGSVSVRHNNSNIINNQAGGSSGDVFMFARDGASAWFGVNNTWYSSGDPTDATTGIFKSGSNPLPTDEPLWMGFSCYGSTSTTWRPYSSQWSYSPPTGFGEMKSTITGTGNAATWNPLAKGTTGTGATLSNGNLSISNASASDSTMSTVAMASGKWYMEAVVTYTQDFQFAITSASNYLPNLYTSATSYTMYLDSSFTYVQKVSGNSAVNLDMTKPTSGVDTLQIAYDADAGKVWFGKNNTWADSGNPCGGSGEQYSSISGPMVFAWRGASVSSASSVVANFGQKPFTYTPPTDFVAASTQNLAELSLSSPATGSFVGNSSTNGPFVYLGYPPDTSGTSTITESGGSASTITWGTHALPLSNGFKIISSANDYNKTATNAYSIAILTSQQFALNNRAR